MTNSLKKIGFLSPFARLFTRSDRDAYELIHFREIESTDEDAPCAFECPDNWSAEAAALLFDEAACKAIPDQLKVIEENTVPSWLWQRVGLSKTVTAETSAQPIFDRVVGAVSYAGWKQGLFADEAQARIFFDEARYALMQRFIAIEPRALTSLGLDWAYGLETKPAKKLMAKKAQDSLEIDNRTIDAIVGGTRDKAVRSLWQQALTAKANASSVLLHFSDVVSDWGDAHLDAPRASLNLMSFRHNDGSVNIEALRQTTRLLVILLDLHGCDALAIGFSNLSPLLMALGLPYDSDAARTMAAAISAIITAEAYAASAECAGLRGASPAFTSNHEAVLRSLRNHCRAAYGDRNDYEKISVLPTPLTVTASPDLGLVAAARRGWDEALQLVRRYGLRHVDVTSCEASPALALFMETASQGVEALRDLTVLHGDDAEKFRREIHPSVSEALTRLGYGRTETRALINHSVGHGTLERAPVINHASLRARGLNAEALARVEAQISDVNDVRLAVTPWVVGEEYCRKRLNLSASKIQKPGFDLLHHFGFTESDIKQANAFCYGHGSMQDAAGLRAGHKAVFMCASEIASEAKIRMAAAVQGFISNDAGLRLTLPLQARVEHKEKLLLEAWRQGIKSVAMTYDASLPAFEAEPVSFQTKRSLRKSTFLHAKTPALPVRKARQRAGNKLVGLGKNGVRTPVLNRNK